MRVEGPPRPRAHGEVEERALALRAAVAGLAVRVLRPHEPENSVQDDPQEGVPSGRRRRRAKQKRLWLSVPRSLVALEENQKEHQHFGGPIKKKRRAHTLSSSNILLEAPS